MKCRRQKSSAKQFTREKVEQPLSISVYPGADAPYLLYRDDGAP
jgi:hypothetical protein